MHRVIYGQAGSDAASRRVDVEVYGFRGVFGFEKEELGNDGGRGRFVHFAIEGDDAFFQQAGKDV